MTEDKFLSPLSNKNSNERKKEMLKIIKKLH